MSEEIVLYTNPLSRGRIALWMLEEVGAPFRTTYLSFGADMKNDAYKAINPVGKVPAIVHDGKIVTEAPAICCYLADVFPETGLAPPPRDRADYYRWFFFAAAPVNMAFTNHFLKVRVPDELRYNVSYSPRDETTEVLDRRLSSSPYLAGESFTAADVMFGVELGWYLQFEVIEPRRAFLDYVERVTARPAYQRAIARDEAALVLADEQAKTNVRAESERP